MPLLLCVCTLAPMQVALAGGPLGIDHRIACDNNGIGARRDQNALTGATIFTVVVGSSVLGAASYAR